MSDVTRLLEAAAAGNSQSAEELLPFVYDELRRLAASRLAADQPGRTLQATALVHEAYMRLVGPDPGPDWNGRSHFFAAAAEAMRHILVDRSRRRNALKRGGGAVRVDLPEDALVVPDGREDVEIVAIHEALDQLAVVDQQAAELVKLRYFVGMTIPEAAEALRVSPRTADRLWTYARAWLRNAVGDLYSDRE